MKRPNTDFQENERNYFMGHFLCVGRWENTTPGELTNSILKHGDVSIINREILNISEFSLPMSAKSELAGLKTKRQTQLDDKSCCSKVSETISNTGAPSRLLNIDQSPKMN